MCRQGSGDPNLRPAGPGIPYPDPEFPPPPVANASFAAKQGFCEGRCTGHCDCLCLKPVCLHPHVRTHFECCKLCCPVEVLRSYMLTPLHHYVESCLRYGYLLLRNSSNSWTAAALCCTPQLCSQGLVGSSTGSEVTFVELLVLNSGQPDYKPMVCSQG